MGKLKKRGFLFSTDALIAIGIIFLVIVMAFPLIRHSTQSSQIHYDVISTLSNLKASEADNAYIESLIEQGVIEDPNKPLLEIIGEFYVSNITIAKNIGQSILQDLDTKENIGIWYGSDLIASKNITSYEEASSSDITKQVISGIQQGGSVTGFSARAYLSNKVRKKYFYFGGYIGEGNLSTQVDVNGTVQEASLEIATNQSFSVYINNNFQGSYSGTSTTTPQEFNLTTSSFTNGTNLVELRGNNLAVSGGFLRIEYQTEAQYEQPTRYYFPGVDGIVNIYDGFYIPGNLNSLSMMLHYNSNTEIFLTIGNKTVFNNTSSGETTTSFTNSQLASLLDYSSLSDKTTPIRLGLKNVSIIGSGLSNIDVVLITDTSGSMDWRLNSDTTGTTRTNCSDPSIYNPSTKRISLAKCLDKSFIETILNSSSDSRVALVSFSNDADNYIDLTRDESSLINEIDSYSASGATCVSCAINRAYKILESSSDSSRIKFIVAMTDGVTNRRSTATCNDLYAEGSSSSALAAGSNVFLIKQAQWNNLTSPLSTDINDIDIYSSNLGFGVGSSGKIIKWDGSSWSLVSSPVSTTLSGIDIYNSTFALAVGSSGSVIKWNGNSWSTLTTVSGGPTLSSVSILSNSLIFASGRVGSGSASQRGRIYKSTNLGSSWNQDYAGGSNIRGIKIVNSSLAFAVGDSGQIVKWTGSWSSTSSPTSEDLYAINSNGTKIVAVGGENGKSIAIESTGGSWSKTLDVSADSLRDIEILNSQILAVGEGSTIYEKSSSWARNFNIPVAYEGLLTQGVSCTSDEESCSETSSFPAINANYSACKTHQDLGATIYSVGFGPIESCGFANITLQAIAQCGNGTFYSSSNATILQKFYSEIAESIIKVSFSEQTVSTQGNISTRLYPDSYIEFNYTNNVQPYGLAITTEKTFDSSTTGTFNVPSNTTVAEAQVLSYSGPKWTSNVIVNGISIYNLSKYGSSYLPLGDPYIINIPQSAINASNNIFLNTGVSPQNTSSGSASNKIIYTIIKNATGYSPIATFANGCIWNMQFESGKNLTAPIPSSYNGSQLCFYREDIFQYSTNDALQLAVFRLLQSLDLDSNGKIDIDLDESEVDIAITQLTGIPYEWSTEVQVRLWR